MDFSTATTNITNTTTEEGFVNPLTIGLLLQLIALADSFGNLMVIIAVALCKNWIITDVLLMSLSVADFLDASVALQMVIFIKYFKVISWSRYSCDAFVVLVYTFRMASATTVTLIAVERAFILVCPLKHHTTVTPAKIKRCVVAVWIFAVVCAILPLIGVGNSGFQGQECYFQLYELGKSYTIFFEVIGLFMLALVLSCYMAIKTAGGKFIKRQSTFSTSKKLRINQPQQSISTKQVRDTHGVTRKTHKRVATTETKDSRGVQSVRKVSTMMGVVVLMYYISWLPFLLSNLASLITGHRPKQSVQLFTGMISFIHALVNPVLYGKMSPRYRKAYLNVIRYARWLLVPCGGKVPLQQNGSVRGHSKLNSAAELNLSQTVYTELAASRSSIPNVNTGATSSKIVKPLHNRLNGNIKTLSQCEQILNNDAETPQQPQTCFDTSSCESNTERADLEEFLNNFQNSSKGDLIKTLTNSDNDVIMNETEIVQSSESSPNDDCSGNLSKKVNEVVKSTIFVQADDEEAFVENDIFSQHNDQPMRLARETLIKQPDPSSLVTSYDPIYTNEVKSHGDRHDGSDSSDDLAQAKQKLDMSTNIENFATGLTMKILSDFIHGN